MDLQRILIDGAVAAAGFSVVVIGLMWVNPRLFLRHAPAAVRAVVEPLSAAERRSGVFGGLLMIGWPFAYCWFATVRFVATATPEPSYWQAYLHALGIFVVVNAVDWLLIDWLLFRAVYPEWMVIPGTYQMAEYRAPSAWARDAYGFVVGSLGGALVALPLGWIAIQGGTVGQEEHDRRVDYVEFQATDMAAVKAFYGDVFGWSFQDWGEDYVSFEDGRLAGGFRRGEPAGAGALVVIYAVDLEAVEAAVREHGGSVVNEIFSFPGGRRFEFEDPAGNRLAVWSDR